MIILTSEGGCIAPCPCPPGKNNGLTMRMDCPDGFATEDSASCLGMDLGFVRAVLSPEFRVEVALFLLFLYTGMSHAEGPLLRFLFLEGSSSLFKVQGRGKLQSSSSEFVSSLLTLVW